MGVNNGKVFDSNVRKGLVLTAIEETLMKISRKDYERVVTRLKTKYNCAISDCYAHPEYLQDILEGLYGESSDQIINEIVQTLEYLEEILDELHLESSANLLKSQNESNWTE